MPRRALLPTAIPVLLPGWPARGVRLRRQKVLEKERPQCLEAAAFPISDTANGFPVRGTLNIHITHMKHKIISRLTALAVCAVLCCGWMLTTSRTAHAQALCNCISISHVLSSQCVHCRDSIFIHNGMLDTILICDTCYSFALTNNCMYGISAIQIFDSTSGGGAKMPTFGCCVVQKLAQDTNWKTTMDSTSITFSDTDAPTGCWNPGETLIVSLCQPMNQGDTITIQWWFCNALPPARPACAVPPGEQLVIP